MQSEAIATLYTYTLSRLYVRTVHFLRTPIIQRKELEKIQCRSFAGIGSWHISKRTSCYHLASQYSYHTTTASQSSLLYSCCCLQFILFRVCLFSCQIIMSPTCLCSIESKGLGQDISRIISVGNVKLN